MPTLDELKQRIEEERQIRNWSLGGNMEAGWGEGMMKEQASILERINRGRGDSIQGGSPVASSSGEYTAPREFCLRSSGSIPMSESPPSSFSKPTESVSSDSTSTTVDATSTAPTSATATPPPAAASPCLRGARPSAPG